jgi:hypothetical protein
LCIAAISCVVCHPEDDPESFLSSYSIAQAIEDADEFFSVVSSAFSDDDDVFYDPSSPYEPFVGS